MADRRDLLKAGAAGAGLAAFAAGYAETARKAVEGVAESLAPRAAAANIHGRSLPPEFHVDAAGAVTPNPGQQVSYTMCMGCTTYCGVRVRVDRSSGRVLRVAGNPYSPLSADPVLPQGMPVRESFAAVARQGDKGLAGRATACGRGAAVLAQMENPNRVVAPLKRVGPRGSGQWQPIPFSQLVREVVEGGNLFGEGEVAGLRKLRSMDPIDPAAPELGPKVNQVAFLSSTNEGRENFARRFFVQSFGTINFTGHGGYCGGSYRSGSGAVFGDVRQMPHAKPDLAHAEFVIFCGTAPANAGNPFKRQGWQLAAGRGTRGMDYVVIDPVLGHSDSLAARDHGKWVPIRPATDGALAMAMMRWMIEHRRWNEAYLSLPSVRAAQAAGEPSFTNATHLVVNEPGHAREGLFLRASDCGLPYEGERYGAKDSAIVLLDGALAAAEAQAGAATLLVEQVMEVGGTPLRLASAATLLRQQAFAHGIEDYAAICGIPAETIVGLAREFTSHGRKAAVNTHGGTMAGNGFANAFALVTLNTLIGNLHWQGGTFQGGGAFPAEGQGPRYNLASFDGAVQPRGLSLSRNNQPYERSSEFKQKQAAGQAYPATRPWFGASPQLGTELMASALDGYPYQVKALFVWNANPVYGIPGLRAAADAALRDPRRIPLVVAIDPFINETGAYADYIVPDSLMYESWGWASAWAGVPQRMSTARWPVVAQRGARTEDGRPVCLESFLIACAKAMGLPGFGANAIKDAGGGLHALETAEDWYLRAGANVAFAGQQPVPDASSEDMVLTGVDRLQPMLDAVLKPEERARVAQVLTRGGRTLPAADVYRDGRFAGKPVQMLHLYNEDVAKTRNALTGRRQAGTPGWTPPAFADGTPMRQHHPEAEWPLLLVSQKSVLLNSYAIGVDRLRGIKPENPVVLHPDDAAPLGLRSGDRIRITTPGGSAEGRVILRRGIMRGVAAVEHGFGHRELGARPHVIGGVAQAPRPALAAGMNLNDLGLRDPSRPGVSIWLDPVMGSAVRQGIPARIARVSQARLQPDG